MSWTQPNHNQYLLHIELSNLCNAACPICPRYWAGSRIVRPGLEPTQVTVKQFKEWFPPEFLKYQTQRVMLCGNQGDPFATKDIVPILEYITTHLPKNRSLMTHSNGGLRRPEVWAEAGKLMQGSESWFMWFSIDGLEDTNHLYRRNVKWTTLMRNVQAYLNAGGNAYWDMLVFKHNEKQIKAVKELAKSLGFLGTRVKNPDGLVWDGKIQKRGVYDEKGDLEYYIEVADDPQYINAPPDMQRNTEPPVSTVGHPPDTWQDLFISDEYNKYEKHEINCKSLKVQGSEIMIQCDGLVLPCCFIGELWSSGRQDLAKQQLNNMWNTDYMYLTKNKINDIMSYLDSTIMSTWNLPDYEQGKCMYCAKICGQDSQIDRLIHTKAGI